MFNKILIANRGEIACRIMKTAKQMGIETVAIYSTVDKDCLHVRKADSAYWVGESFAKSSYLNIEAIILAAQKSHAEAIHPGYGFLSENPKFAKACHDAGIVFIGPSIAAMEAMASKQLAKQMLEKTNVPLTPGYHGQDQSDQRLLAEAKYIGFPILLKAANGGGGKGMRAVHHEADFLQALASARREAMASFGDDTMIIEKLLLNPRHIEVQIMADNHANIVHLFERDCTIQRRHQKIIEEAPAPHLDETTRFKLTQSACDVARSIEYRGAGTVEFILDNNTGQFYFMEMNTRLQVEHPVTEMITGLDLVAWQIQIAANQPLPCSQEQLTKHGHAIECRIYAEDPNQDFIPSIGKLCFLREPSGEGIRIDTGVTVHSSISQYYDPMIAKLIVFGETRELARHKLQRALQQYAIGGIKSNIPFLQAICQHPRFVRGELSTAFLTEETIQFAEPDKHLALLFATCYDYLTLLASKEDALLRDTLGWQMHLPSYWQYRYAVENRTEIITVTPDNKVSKDNKDNKAGSTDAQFIFQGLGETRTLQTKCIQDRIFINDGEKIISAWVENYSHHLIVYLPQGCVTIERCQNQETNQNKESSPINALLTAPMPATVIAILKKQGDIIKKGEPLIILEAMKMEHTIHAPKDGVLSELLYKIGAQVNEGDELLTLKDENCVSS